MQGNGTADWKGLPVDELVVAAVQVASEIGEADRNARALCGWIGRAARRGAGLVAFPECCLTGYAAARAGEVAIGLDDPCAAAVEEAAADHGVAVGYGLVERRDAGGRPFATYVVASPDARLTYRKAHLGASEAGAFSAGDELPTARFGNVCVGVGLCWEAHLPDVAATLRAKGAQLALMPHAGGPGGTRRLELWRRYLPARALDNGLFVIACNALRRDAEDGMAGGGMAAYAPDGTCIAEGAPAKESMLLAKVGGPLPREAEGAAMRPASYFDRRRPELYGALWKAT